MQSIDKNDVDITKLFRWGNEFDIEVQGDTLKVYIRLVGDAEVNRARVFALRKSAELRSKLKDLESEERRALIPPIEEANKENLVELTIMNNINEYGLDAIGTVKVPYPKELRSDATLQQQEDYQKEIDEYPKKREEAIRVYIEKRAEQDRKILKKKSIDNLYKEFEASMIETFCENEMLKNFRELCIYFGSYKDPDYKERLFNAYEQFENLPTPIKEQFRVAYDTLEIGSDVLKK